MKKTEQKATSTFKKTIIKKCHLCGHLNESRKELANCQSCRKGFLPLNYFSKVHAKTTEDYKYLFADSNELELEDLVKGLYVLW